MPFLRRSRLPGLLLLLVLGFALLLPEIAHSLAHRDQARAAAVAMDDHDHDHHHQQAAAEAHPHQGVMMVVEQAAAVHEHFELRPIAPNKTSFPLILATQSVVECVCDATLQWSPPKIRQDQLTIPLRNHGPPLPGRSPPLS